MLHINHKTHASGRKTIKGVKNFFFFLLLLFPEYGKSESRIENIPFFKSATSPIEITADRVTYRIEKGEVVFEGNVKVVQDDLKIFSDTGVVYLDAGKKIEKITFSGFVKIEKGDTVIVSTRAVFLNSSQTLIIKGNPKAWKGKDYIEGEEFIYRVSGNELTVKKANLFISGEKKE